MAVRRLLPDCGDERLEDLYLDLQFPPSPEGGRPFVYVNMVTTADGAATLEGRTRGMGGPADRLAFHRLREYCDAVLVGAGTVRVERYGPPRLDPEAQARRAQRGLAPLPRMVVVSRSLELDPSQAVFTAPGTVVLTVRDADPRRRARLASAVEVVGFGDGTVDLREALAWLHAQGVRRLLCEGGPTLNAHLLAAGLVDELFLTVAPLVVGGGAARIVAGRVDGPRRLALVELRASGEELLARYRVG